MFKNNDHFNKFNLNLAKTLHRESHGKLSPKKEFLASCVAKSIPDKPSNYNINSLKSELKENENPAVGEFIYVVSKCVIDIAINEENLDIFYKIIEEAINTEEPCSFTYPFKDVEDKMSKYLVDFPIDYKAIFFNLMNEDKVSDYLDAHTHNYDYSQSNFIQFKDYLLDVYAYTLTGIVEDVLFNFTAHIFYQIADNSNLNSEFYKCGYTNSDIEKLEELFMAGDFHEDKSTVLSTINNIFLDFDFYSDLGENKMWDPRETKSRFQSSDFEKIIDSIEMMINKF